MGAAEAGALFTKQPVSDDRRTKLGAVSAEGKK